jgi:hypothetical protein
MFRLAIFDGVTNQRLYTLALGNGDDPMAWSGTSSAALLGADLRPFIKSRT